MIIFVKRPVTMIENRCQDQKINDNILIELRKITQAIDLSSKKLVKQVGLTGPQMVILLEISRLGTVSVGEVAKNVSLSQGTVTVILERMEKRGLVVRQRNGNDKRRVMVRITDSGNEFLADAPSVIQESVIPKINELQEWEKNMILSALQRLVYIMNATEKKAVSIFSSQSLILQDPQTKPTGSSSVT